MEMCIAIRTLMANGRRVSAQAGAGIVYDSKPAAEYQETVNKARALFTAVAQAEARVLDAPPKAVADRAAAGRRRGVPAPAPARAPGRGRARRAAGGGRP